jgi:hypothetical protein
MAESFAIWVIARRSRAATVALVIGLGMLVVLGTAQFTAWLPAAYVGFLVLVRRDRWALGAAALIALPVFAWLAGQGEPVWAVGTAAALVLPGLAGAMILRRTGSFNLAVQVLVLGGVLIPVAAHLLLADPAAVFRPAFEEAGRMLRQHGWPGAEAVETASAQAWGALGLVTSANAVVGLVAALYWQSKVSGQPEAGPRFRELRLGKVLSLLLAVITVSTLFSHSGLATNMAYPLVGGLVLQALALVHWSREAFQLGAGWLVFAYVSLLMPFMLAVWACVGFIDNWWPLRPRLQQLKQRR